MKTIKLILAVCLLVFGAQAYAIVLSPGSEIDKGPNAAIDPNNSNSEIVAYVESTYGVTGLYKQNQGGSEEGAFASSYATAFTYEDVNDATGGTITYTGGPSIACPLCYLLVKDGNSSPYWYLFSLNAWNGTEQIVLSGFWPDPTRGAISHVEIFGAPSNVPTPAPLAVLALGLMGFLISGRTKKIS